MSALVLLAVLVAVPDAGARAKPKAAAPIAVPLVVQKQGGHGGVTVCAACHSTSSWTDVRFNHDRTGFPLTGQHQKTSCKACHTVDFAVPVAQSCNGCHRDVHAGELGARCEGCHDTVDWRARFDVEAHRRTNFPLVGAHAALPCVECHAEARERRFSRAAVDCAACHQADTARTRGTAVDHVALGFELRNCRECHGPSRFTPALFAEHDRCFPLSAGPHAGIACATCHTSLSSGVTLGTCRTGTAACTGCHTHQCTTAGGVTETDRQHAQVPGYQCANRKCYECHQVTGSTP